MTWLIIALLLLAAFGPVFWLLPSRSDRRLAAMRARARALGIHVELTRLKDLHADATARVTAGGKRLDPTVECAAYKLGLARTARWAPRWKILRNAGATDGPIDGWSWDSAPAGDASYWRDVAQVVNALPADALACAADAREATCWWRERSAAQNAESSVDELHSTLDKLARIQLAADERAAPVDDADDSIEGSSNTH